MSYNIISADNRVVSREKHKFATILEQEFELDDEQIDHLYEAAKSSTSDPHANLQTVSQYLKPYPGLRMNFMNILNQLVDIDGIKDGELDIFCEALHLIFSEVNQQYRVHPGCRAGPIYPGLSGYKTQFVFALTSIAVGIREEILYRGVLQTLIEKRLGWIWAIVLSNVVFTLYHYGAWEFTTSKVLELFFVGCFVGLLYRGTGSLIIAIVFHSIYDAIWCFTPYLEKPWHWAWGSAMQILAAALILFWV